MKLQMEVEGLNDRLKEKILENEDIKTENNRLRIEVNSVASLQMKTQEYENRITVLLAEIEK